MKILILGCGWVGEEFALHALNNGHEVWASTTQPTKMERLKSLGISTFLFDSDVENSSLDISLSFDYVLTSIPSASKNSVAEVELRFENVAQLLSTVSYKKHIFLSSTGVYPNIDAVIDEEFDKGLNERLQKSEGIMLQLPNTSIYRLGGLFGKNRIFAKYFANRICNTGDQLANFVHLDDVVALIDLGFEKLIEEGIYNVVCPDHPTKKEVVFASAQKYGFELPVAFEPTANFRKIVLSDKIVKALDYRFHYVSPLDF